MTLQEFLQINRKDILHDLNRIVDETDVRLCVDRISSRIDDDAHEQDYTWCLRTGDASYDQRHSDYCAASTITPDTDTSDLLDTLIVDILEQYP